jgi:excisionase family DNA binding protein
MLIHEWMKFRDKHLPRREPEEEGIAPEVQSAEPEPGEPEAGDGQGTSPVGGEALRPAEARFAPEAPEEPKEPVSLSLRAEEAADAAVGPAGRPTLAPPLPIRPTALAFPDLPEAQSRRLQALLARQRRLPLEVEPPASPRRDHPEPAESREELIERLLDPILSINEAATLCGVCPASIRRYTNRGVLKCFRTPGNQRRFRLSDVLDFMERQQEETLD